MGGCMRQGHRALSYYLTRASTSNENLGEMCLHGTGICSHQNDSFLWQWIAICDPWRSEWRIAIHDTQFENRNIVKIYDYFLCTFLYSACFVFWMVVTWSCAHITWLMLKLIWNLYSRSESYYLYICKLFLLRCVNPTALLLVHCYSIRSPQRVASWVNYSSCLTKSSTEHFASDISLLKADTLWCDNKRCSKSNNDLWIRKRVCYPLHHSAPPKHHSAPPNKWSSDQLHTPYELNWVLTQWSC